MADQTSLEKNLEVKPLTFPSPSPNRQSTDTIDQESSNFTSSSYLTKRRTLFWCCGCCGSFVVVLGFTILILAFTVFKVKDPTLTLNSLYLEDINTGFVNQNINFNATLTADISIKNPNVASFKFDNSTTEFYYAGNIVGVGYAGDGNIKAHRTAEMNVTVDVLLDRVGKTNISGMIVEGALVNFTTFTDLKGRVDLWGIYKRDLEILLNCSLSVDVGIQMQEIKNKVCVANVK